MISSNGDDSLSESLWPLIFLPERNLSNIFRRMPMKKIEGMFRAATPPTYSCIINEGREGGMGKSELMLEFCHRNVSDGTFAVVGWISCSEEASVVSSYRYLARRIKLSDPSFGSKADVDVDRAHKTKLISCVTEWIESSPMIWLLVFDRADDATHLSDEMFPKKGKGCVAITTVSSGLSQLELKLPALSNILELGPFSEKESLEIMNVGMKGEVVEEPSKDLVHELNFYPLELSLAIGSMNVMRSRSHLDIGPVEYLSRLRYEMPSLGGTPKEPDGKEISRAANLYKCFVLALYTAYDHPTAVESTVTRIIELFAFLSSDNIPISLVIDWLISPFHSVSLSVAKDVRRRKSSSQLEELIEYEIEVSSLYPRGVGRRRSTLFSRLPLE